MALSMNQSKNRKDERISILCKCLLMDVKDLVLTPNNCLDMQTPLSSSFISGVIDGDHSEVSWNSRFQDTSQWVAFLFIFCLLEKSK
jgi:hypothetical protein